MKSLVKTLSIFSKVLKGQKPIKFIKNISPKALIVIWLAVMLVFSSITAYAMYSALPKKPMITRAALAKEVTSKNNIPLVKDLPRYFKDVPKNDKYYNYVQTAYYLGFIDSKNKIYFKPKAYADEATRERAFQHAGNFKIALDLKRKNKETPKWIKPEIEEALDKIVAAYTSTNPFDVFGVYEPMPNFSATRKPVDTEIEKSTKIKQIEQPPEWYISARKIGIKAQTKSTIKDDTGAHVSDFEQGTVVNISYRDGIYVVGLSTGQYFTGGSNNIRISPSGNPQIIEFSSYRDSGGGSTNYNKFRGEAIIAYSAKSNRLWAINELPIEDYLRGLREGSTNDTLEYLKVLITASRSYGYYYILAGGKHSGEPFHLKNSRMGNGNDQVYVGYNIEPVIKNQIQAVENTKGIVATYNGNVIITPYSSGTDGRRTRTAAEVWGRKDMPWTQSVKDPHGYISNWATLEGNHMAGLSAQGARGFISKDRKTYEWVLKYYFKDIALKKMDINQKIKVAIFSIPAS